MHINTFDYDLPETLIAHEPIEPRSESRLLLVNRNTAEISHHMISDLPTLLPKKSCLVFNETKVIKARLYGRRSTGGKVEIFLTHHRDGTTWDALLKPAAKLKNGETITIAKDFACTIIQKHVSDGKHRVTLQTSDDMFDAIESHGHTPLPPYIHTDNPDQFHDRYQTIFAATPGAVAAPTASLHFDDNLVTKLHEANIPIEKICLHVGYGTFKPIQTENIKDHTMHSEYAHVARETSEALNAHQPKGPVIAIGTTTLRTLESCYTDGRFQPMSGETDIYIYPGGRPIQAVQGLLTNFHLPKSSLLLLVSAFAGTDLIRHAYQTAIQENYRFYSFGDAMLII